MVLSIFAEDLVRRDFLAALEGDPPAAVLLTNSQWPQPDGFDAADRWPELAALLASRYVLDRSENKTALPGGSTSGARRQTKSDAVLASSFARGSIVILSAKTPHGAAEVIE